LSKPVWLGFLSRASFIDLLKLDNNFELISGKTTRGKFLSALTGQSFEKQYYTDPETGETKEVPLSEQLLAALGDIGGSAFTAGMGPVGAGVTTARLGYRLGNFLGDYANLSEEPFIRKIYGSSKDYYRADSASQAIVSAKQFGLDKNQLEEGEVSEQDLKNYRKYLKEELEKGKSLDQYKAGGFIPNFAVSKEMEAIKNSPDYVGYRNATPIKSSVYNDKVINSAEIEVPAKEVYARMFGPAGYGMSPKNPSETHAVLNPAQQSALGYAGGFVPNFSSEQFSSMMSDAMKNGMASFMANGFMPAASNSNVVNINDNRNVQGSIEANPGVFDEVVQVLMKMHPKEMATIGPKITRLG